MAIPVGRTLLSRVGVAVRPSSWGILSSTSTASRSFAAKASASRQRESPLPKAEAAPPPPPSEDEEIPTEGISRPLVEILRELSKKVPDSFVRTRVENDFALKYIPWHIVNRILNLHAPEWSGEVRNIVYSPDSKSVTVVYRVTLYGTDAEIYRESTGTAPVECKGYGDAVQNAESMAFRRACARLGLGLHLYHEEL